MNLKKTKHFTPKKGYYSFLMSLFFLIASLFKLGKA